MLRYALILPMLGFVGIARSSWVVQKSGSDVQYRGVAAVSASVCWAAGSNGTFALTTDGITWSERQVPGAEKLIFRSVVAWDAKRATLLAVGLGDASRIYHTEDGGQTWALQFTNADPKAFYDAIQFWDAAHGIALGDPVDGKFRILRTDDGGKSWSVVPTGGMPEALEGEGAFAASGTCLVVNGGSEAWFATGGGSLSRVFRSGDRGMHWTVAQTPIAAGKDSAGVFGLAFRDAKNGVAVGGDYKEPAAGTGTIAATADGGRTWTTMRDARALDQDSHQFAEGLFEGVGFADAQTVVAVGPSRARHASGIKSLAGDADGGPIASWQSDVSDVIVGLHACSFLQGVTDPLAQTGWAVGDKGLIVKWIWQPG